jgi:hypothetical protein
MPLHVGAQEEHISARAQECLCDWTMQVPTFFISRCICSVRDALTPAAVRHNRRPRATRTWMSMTLFDGGNGQWMRRGQLK